MNRVAGILFLAASALLTGCAITIADAPRAGDGREVVENIHERRDDAWDIARLHRIRGQLRAALASRDAARLAAIDHEIELWLRGAYGEALVEAHRDRAELRRSRREVRRTRRREGPGPETRDEIRDRNDDRRDLRREQVRNIAFVDIAEELLEMQGRTSRRSIQRRIRLVDRLIALERADQRENRREAREDRRERREDRPWRHD
ncbi:MAG: hypothetical protein D6738_06070 [Acidobacteria bacterium]|nr:MAG: hypothetical protein D6738_06070 [Acidobacteriota bacterium]